MGPVEREGSVKKMCIQYPFEGKSPRIHPGCFVAENAVLIGDVTLEEDASVWYGAVLRGDAGSIRLGRGTNVQDCAVLHCDRGFDLTLGEQVTVGHCAIVHGATVGNRVIVGMHATLLNGCQVGDDCIIGAGALVREGQVIPPGSLVVGAPARVVRELTPEQRQTILWNGEHYVALAQKHRALNCK